MPKGEGRTTMASNESDCWTMQGDNDGGNDGGGDVVALAVTVTRVGGGRGRTR
jgi:hypothetical protein